MGNKRCSYPIAFSMLPEVTARNESSEKIKEVMADIQTKTTMEKFTTNDKENYYSGITSIMVNGKRAYELKGKLLDDLRDNAFCGTNGEDAVEHIEYFPKIVDPINLPNVNYERLRLFVFSVSLVRNASEWFDEFKGSITKGVADEEFFDAKEANNYDEQETAEIFRIETNLFDYETPLCTEFKEFNFLLKVDPELFTHNIERTKTYEDYENELNDELEELWSKDGVPYEICDHICEPFRFKNGKAKWPTCNSNEDGFSDGNLKEETLKQKAIYEKSWGDASQCVMNFCAWLKRNHIQGPYANYYSNCLDKLEHVDKDKHGLFDDQKRPICNIRRFEMIKYSFGEDDEYVAIKEHEYDDLTSTNEDACRTYQ
ncbi:hypothetical protein Tco_1490994 [Tanacetum coccineum]